VIDGQSCRPDEQEGSVTSRDILSHAPTPSNPSRASSGL